MMLTNLSKVRNVFTFNVEETSNMPGSQSIAFVSNFEHAFPRGIFRTLSNM